MPTKTVINVATGDVQEVELTSAEIAQRVQDQVEHDAQKKKEYRINRGNEYPSSTDLLDALAKKEAGDSDEWDALMVARAAVKKKYPKE